MKLKVFISSPYTNGDVEENVKVQHDVFQKLFEDGYMPFAPLLFHYQHIAHPLEYDKWMEIDFAWLDSCDFILRLPGESKGSEKEVVYADEHGIPVVYSLHELKEKTKNI